MRKRVTSSPVYSYSQTRPSDSGSIKNLAENDVKVIQSKRHQCGYICNKKKTQVRVWLYHKDGGIAWDMWIMFLCFVSVCIYILQTYAESKKANQIISLSTFQCM